MKKLLAFFCLTLSFLFICFSTFQPQAQANTAPLETTAIVDITSDTGNKLAQSFKKCAMNEESFGFELRDYPIEHQIQALLDISVKFRLVPEVKDDTTLYPDFVVIAEDIQDFLVNYPNETDYWEILNNNLVAFLMKKYTSIASLRVMVDVDPTTPRAHYERYSVVTVTRPGQCPLIAQMVS